MVKVIPIKWYEEKDLNYMAHEGSTGRLLYEPKGAIHVDH
jgi:hypothetical protein